MGLQNNQKPMRLEILKNLVALRDSEQEAARHLFVVCGKPETQRGFEMAWAKEDAEWFAQWCLICALIRTIEAGVTAR